MIEEAEAGDEDEGKSELPQKDQNKEPLFDNKAPLEKTWCISYIFFYWLTPLVNYINTHGQISVEKYGKLRKKDMVENYIVRLKAEWDKRASLPNANSRHTLFMSLLVTFKWELIFWLCLSECIVVIDMI